MSKKQTFKKTAALLMGIAIAVGSTGCNFFPTDSEKDLAQVVANVNISNELKKDDAYSEYASAVNQLISDGQIETEIKKSELVSYFLSVGYTYVNNYGYSYEDTFNMLMDALVSRKIIIQYATAYYLKNGLSAEDCQKFIDAEIAAADEDEKALLKAHPEVSTMKYFLTENGADMEAYNQAVYALRQSLNASLDSLETSYINAENGTSSSTTARTTPTGVSTEKEDYCPLNEKGEVDYGVYTGRNTLDSCGEYEKVDGSTASTRKMAYNAFLANLDDYGLIKDKENTADVNKLDYYYVELASSLSQAFINKYYEDLQEDSSDGLTDEFIANKYAEIMGDQKYKYAKDSSAFETAIGSVSDDSFVLYGQEGYGFVYNILIPFSASQEQAYSAEKSKGLSDDELFVARKNILADVQAKDLRGDWFSADEKANYAYEATGSYFDNGAAKGDKTYLFFEDSMVNTDRYEGLKQYAGMYPYNGTVEKEDDEYTFKANKLSINEFITEMENYIDFVVGKDVTKDGKYLSAYNTNVYTDADGVVDYDKFIYYEGKVALENTNAKDYFKKDNNDAYAAVSAVNELMFAYSTDTGCLNTYMGYVVSPYKTNFVPEFEAAAQYAVEKGEGTYVVCGTDYGWHIIYVSHVYENDGDVYGGYNPAEKEVEGTFSYLFYESLKATTSNSYTNVVQSNILNRYSNDNSVTLYKSRYQDLLDL